MSYGGYEYSHQQSYGGGGYLDPMGGFNAGGYMDNSYGVGGMAGGFMNNTGGEIESKGSDKKKIGDRQSFIPVTAKQLFEANKVDDLYMIDGHELHTVQLVGALYNLKLDSTNITFKLNDHTSVPLDCKQWLDKDKPSNVTSFKDGTMVRVIGNIREYDNKKHLLVFNVSRITDWNMVTHQILGVIFTHCQHTKGPIPGSSTASSAVKQQQIGNNATVKFGNSLNSPAPNYMNNMRGGVQGFGATGGDNMVDQVYRVYTEMKHAEEGLNIQYALQQLRNKGVNIDMHGMRDYVLQLCDDGRLYSTVDDDHHNPTSAEY